MQSLDSVSRVLIPVEVRDIGGEQCQSVDARDLHAFLGVGKKFADWMTDRVSQYSFAEDVDFVVIPEIGKNGGRPLKQYYISLDMAKELSMVERTAKGKEARQYFIDCERRALAAPAITAADMAQTLRDFAQLVGVKLDEHGRVIQHVSARVDAVEQRVESGFHAMNSRFDDIETRLVRRATFSQRAQALFIQTAHRFYAGRCPCCQETVIISPSGQPLMDLFRLDHWNGKQHNMISNGWPVCVSCNRALERKRHEKHLAFALFHQNLSRLQQIHGIQLELPLIQGKKAA